MLQSRQRMRQTSIIRSAPRRGCRVSVMATPAARRTRRRRSSASAAPPPRAAAAAVAAASAAPTSADPAVAAASQQTPPDRHDSATAQGSHSVGSGSEVKRLPRGSIALPDSGRSAASSCRRTLCHEQAALQGPAPGAQRRAAWPRCPRLRASSAAVLLPTPVPAGWLQGQVGELSLPPGGGGVSIRAGAVWNRPQKASPAVRPLLFVCETDAGQHSRIAREQAADKYAPCRVLLSQHLAPSRSRRAKRLSSSMRLLEPFVNDDAEPMIAVGAKFDRTGRGARREGMSELSHHWPTSCSHDRCSIARLPALGRAPACGLRPEEARWTGP